MYEQWACRHCNAISCVKHQRVASSAEHRPQAHALSGCVTQWQQLHALSGCVTQWQQLHALCYPMAAAACVVLPNGSSCMRPCVTPLCYPMAAAACAPVLPPCVTQWQQLHAQHLVLTSVLSNRHHRVKQAS